MSGFNFDKAWDGPVQGKGIAGEVSPQQASNLLQDKLDKLDQMRQELAACYGAIPGSNIELEHEIGESLTAVRKAIKRCREALGKVSQLKLPLDD